MPCAAGDFIIDIKWVTEYQLMKMLLFGNIARHGWRTGALISFKYEEMYLIIINMKLLCIII